MIHANKNYNNNYYVDVHVHALTLWLFIFVNILDNPNLVEPVICHLQHKTPIYHTVTGFESTVDDIAMVQVLHTLMTVCRNV